MSQIKKELNPALFWGVIVLLAIGLATFYFMQNRQPPAIDMNTISPERLEDPDKRGQ